jgi:DegV family protein with EDD domain
VIGLVVDSNSQIPPALVRRYEVEVVPLTVTVDGVAHAEGEDLDADRFWAAFEGRTPVVATSQPSPGRFSDAYAAVAARGADEILSVHIGSALSGTVNSARLASASAPVPVRVVDTGTASFGVACCLWEAAEAVGAGASLEEAAGVAESVAATIGTVFVVGALDLARSGGRLATTAEAGAGVPVLTLAGAAMEVVGHVDDLDGAARAMAARVVAAGSALRVGVGVADPATAPLGHALADRLTGAPEVTDLVRYRVGPSVGAHTGPGTVGAFWYPVSGRGPR